MSTSARATVDGAALEAELDAILAPSGLTSRGGFNFLPGEDAPEGPSGRRAGSVVLIGNAGARYWPAFETWRGRQPPDLRDPLDTWSREVIRHAALAMGATALSPSDRPFQPFQRWAMRAEGLGASPLGILIHPRYGLWHAYRGALLFDRAFAWQKRKAQAQPCDSCAAKPCLKSCPVEAYDSVGFACSKCLAWVRAPHGGRCRRNGCLDRNACPVGADFRYPPHVQAFHMDAFAEA